MINHYQFKDGRYYPTQSRIQECVPGIIDNGELKNLNKHQSELKDEELFYRVQQR